MKTLRILILLALFVAPAAQPQDLWMKDTPLDGGGGPNMEDAPMWESPDVWYNPFEYQGGCENDES